jgi:phosphatidylglycerol lysyltransferase
MAVALVGLHREWAAFEWDNLTAAMGRLGWMHVGLAIFCTVLGYVSYAAIDLFSLRWLGCRVGIGRALGNSCVAAAFSLNAGGTLLGGGGVRMRVFTRLGLTPAEVARMTGFTMVAGWTGHTAVAGGLLLISPSALPALSGLATRCLGLGLLLVAASVVGLNAWRRRKGEVTSDLPHSALLGGAILVSALDWVFAGLAIRVLMPTEMGALTTPAFLAVVLVSQLVSALSHVPGGMGVLELSITKLVGAAVSSVVLAAALLSYRVIYYFGPFVVAVAWMGGREAWAHRHHFARGAGAVGGFWRKLGPRIGPLIALAGGFVLLLSADTPMAPARRAWLEQWVPLSFVETSHFLSSIVGVMLIIVARGLQRRVQAAWWAAVMLSFTGVIFSLLKGVDYEEATVMGLLLLCLIPYRDHFHRHSAVWSGRFTFEWWVLLIGLTGVSVWLGFFASRHVEYQGELWWQFSFEGDASRFLRAQVGVAVVLIGLMAAQWLRRTPPKGDAKSQAVTPEQWEAIERLVEASPRSQAHLALLGDKMFHFSASGRSFVMFGEQGRSRIVMGDPVGDPEEWDELLWNFNERAEDDGRRVCYYEIAAENIGLYVDMGMRLYKLGEEARVSLVDFDIESPSSSRLRQARRRAERDGLEFAMWSAAQVVEGMAALRAISDQWLARHSAAEKSFSLGRFDETYLQRGPVAVITKDGVPCAFANLWCSGGREELSVDLMRQGHEAPGGLMDFLFAELFIWGKGAGYQSFGLGMAPLSGLAAHPLAPMWHKLGALVFQRGGAFYNFQGLRDFKDKFHPEWEPRYLAVPSAWQLPAALSDITALVAGGWRNVITRPKGS